MTTPGFLYNGMGNYGLGSSLGGPSMAGTDSGVAGNISLGASVGGGNAGNAPGMIIVLGGLVILYVLTRSIQGSR